MRTNYFNKSFAKKALVTSVTGLLVAAAISGCSQQKTGANAAPAGLTTAQATQLNKAQYGDLAANAKTTLKPEKGSFLDGKTIVSTLASTVPVKGNVMGDENPYAVVPIKSDKGILKAGDILVSNFNDKTNNQGTGRSIVDVHPNHTLSVFANVPKDQANCPGGIGLTTAMVQLQNGWIIVGSLPAPTGQATSIKAGCLIAISPEGKVGGTITDKTINGPWDATVHFDGTDKAQLFVTNVADGVAASKAEQKKGTVVRIDLSVPANAAPTATKFTVIGDGFGNQADASTLVNGPTGLALDAKDPSKLYVSDRLGNRIAVIDNALERTDSAHTGKTLTEKGQLAGPLGMAIAPNGDIITANAQNGKVVETTTAGKQVGEFYAAPNVGQDPPGNGDLFGIAISQDGKGLIMVRDDNNVLSLLH